MSNITINSRIYVKENFAKSDSGIAHASSITEQKAQQAAEAAAKNAAASVAWDNISTESSLNKIIGSNSRVTTTINTPHATYNQSTSFWDGRCSWSVSSNNSWLQQVHLKFNVNGISANNISSATLTINNGNGGIGENYYICAPKDSTTNISDNIYYHPNNNNLNKNNKQFKIDSFPYQIDITDQLKQCINAGIGVLIITSNLSTPTYTNQISGFNDNSFSINYQETISACTPPTSISNNGSAYIVSNGSISLNLGEGGGEGVNNPITGYRIYWKSGAVPYIGGAEGFYDYYGTNTIITFNTATAGTFPSVRGNTYYFKVCTRGSYAVNNAFLSPISNTYVSIVYNQLPDAPIVSVDKSRIKSGGSTTEVNFTTTPGNDFDTSQTRSVRYSTSIVTPTISNTTLVTNNQLSQDLNSAITFYFWTYDGYEFSTNYTEKNIRINISPTITSVTMSSNMTFSPVVRDGYAKNINGTAIITKDPDATLTYQWKLQYVNGVNNSINASSSTTNISTAISLSDIDVTLYGANFDTAYRLCLTITDDLNESVTGYSSQTFGIPAAPTITFINQHNDSNVIGTTIGHFDTNVRFKYSVNNTGIDTIELWNGDSKIKNLSKNNNEAFIDTTLNELARGTLYNNLKLKFICNNISTFSNISQVYRAADITPINITITPSGGSSIKPYTQQNFTIKFGGYVTGDVSDDLSNIYMIKINNMEMNCGYEQNQNNNILGTVILNDKTTTNWKTLLGLNNAPNAVYTLPLTITATNLFGKTFTPDSTNITLNFIESLTDNGSTKITIKNTNSDFSDIPSSYDSEDRYPLFETQIIKLTISEIQCYADQNADIEFYENTTKLGTIKINNNDWIAQNNSYIYQLINSIEFEYIIPKITSDLDVNYWVKVILANNQYNSYDTNLDICKYCKFNESKINFSITDIDKNDNEIDWECNNLGSNNLSTKNCEFYTTNILSNDFNDYKDHPFGSSFSINSTTGSTPGTIPTYDIVYFGVKLTLTSNFQLLANNMIPFGEPEHIIKLTNLYTLYNQVPNLLYGKNFFLLNGTSIGSNSDGMLYLHTTRSRTKIYFGNSDQAKFEITQNGLIIDGGTWDS